ncbi:MAG TPA: BlaI/MecI/CopY family transcriptional regulator [Ilumatobacteraceae bacterium]|nr:BlaI/MecI/CopY family transcriptional regulator [Ilumatobacteraceae bacterium]
MSRRPDGELEAEVLRALWSLERPASPADVMAHMQTDLAYTSIATVLGRLCEKGLANRQRRGRSFLYAAATTEADLIAGKIHSLLDATRDRASALAGVASCLDPDSAACLAALLKGRA